MRGKESISAGKWHICCTLNGKSLVTLPIECHAPEVQTLNPETLKTGA